MSGSVRHTVRPPAFGRRRAHRLRLRLGVDVDTQHLDRRPGRLGKLPLLFGELMISRIITNCPVDAVWCAFDVLPPGPRPLGLAVFLERGEVGGPPSGPPSPRTATENTTLRRLEPEDGGGGVQRLRPRMIALTETAQFCSSKMLSAWLRR